MQEFHDSLTEEGFGPQTRSLYFFWIDRYIVENRNISRETIHKIVNKMVDGRFVHNAVFYDYAEEQYLLVCRLTLSLYDVVFFLPTREGYLSGDKYFMRIKGKIDLVSLRRLFGVFRISLSGSVNKPS